METGLDRRAMIPHPAEGRPQDLPLDVEYLVRPDYSNANLRQAFEAIGKVLFTGVMCQDGGYYGDSDTTHCRLTLPDDYTEVGDVLQIGDGTREWRVAVVVDNAIEFTDTELTKGASGTENYDTIKDQLRFWTMASSQLAKIVTRNEICLGDYAEGLHADDIQRANGIADTVFDLFTSFEVQHTFDPGGGSDGVHADEFLKNAMLDKDDVLISQGFINRIQNGAFNINNEASKDYWKEVGSPVSVTPVKYSVCPSFPQYWCEIATDDIDEGIKEAIVECEYGYPIRLSFFGRGELGGEVIKAILYTDYGSVTAEITLTTSWTRYYLTFEVNDNCTAYVRFVSNTASTQEFHLALVNVSFGDVHSFPERSPLDVLFDAVHTVNFYLPTLQAAGADKIYATWTPKRAIKMIRTDAYVNVAVATADATIRLTDSSNNVDTTITVGNNAGSNTSTTQEFAKDAALTVKVLTNTTTAGDICNFTIQYRMN